MLAIRQSENFSLRRDGDEMAAYEEELGPPIFAHPHAAEGLAAVMYATIAAAQPALTSPYLLFPLHIFCRQFNNIPQQGHSHIGRLFLWQRSHRPARRRSTNRMRTQPALPCKPPTGGRSTCVPYPTTQMFF
jgi:hypothetical protein